MKVKTISKPLPNSLSPANFANPEIRRVVQVFGENIKVLKKQIEELQSAINNMQRR
jgi:hypothetical protein